LKGSRSFSGNAARRIPRFFIDKTMLEAIDVSLSFQRRALLRGVSLTIRSGEVLALVGVNGAGKSTLLKILAGDRSPDAGRVKLAGRLLPDWSLTELARRRAVLPQDSRLAFPFSALEVVLMGRFPYSGGYPSRQDIRLARAVMEDLDVIHLQDRLYPTLSGGERARVQLSRALCQLLDNGTPEPCALLLDEPTASLDLAHQHTALAAARRFAREENGAVCAVLHDLNLAAQYADRIAVLAEGRIVACGPPWEVLTEAILGSAFEVEVLVGRHPKLDCPWIATAPNTKTISPSPSSQ
jgi:iron complex transport system ATP-binding protein